jgi:aflatoxin B1 aldehyde reductase
LNALEAKTVDIFYLHAADRSIPFQETLAAVDKMHKEGKFVNLGLSNFAAFEVAEVCLLCKANNWVRPTVWQGAYG